MAYTKMGAVLSTQEAVDLQLEQGGQAAYASESALSIEGVGAVPMGFTKYLPWVGAGAVVAFLVYRSRK